MDSVQTRWEMQSRVMCNSLCGVKVNVTEERSLVASGWKSMNQIHDRYNVLMFMVNCKHLLRWNTVKFRDRFGNI